MAPAGDGDKTSKGKSKRSKRKKTQSAPANSSFNDDSKELGEPAEEVRIDLMATVSVRRDCPQSQEELFRKTQRLCSQAGLKMECLSSHTHEKNTRETGQVGKSKSKYAHFDSGPSTSAAAAQQHCGRKDEDENISINFERQPLLFQLEKIFSFTSGRSELVFVIVRLRSTEINRPVVGVFLGEAHRISSIGSDRTLRRDGKIIAYAPSVVPSPNGLLRIRGAIDTLASSIVHWRSREILFTSLVDFYRRFLHLSRQTFLELRGFQNFWRQLNILERHISNLTRLSFATSNLSKRKSRTEKLKMVHEVGPHCSRGQSGVVNSTSLEDVPLSEASDRAQSIQSLHSAPDTPTPDGTPSFDELQQRLDEYNRHIEQMNEQKNQLMRMQNDARQHLMLLEEYQKECNERNLSFGGSGQDDESQPPNYESVTAVKNDMAVLARRCDNVTRLVDSQRNLVDQLPREVNEELRSDQAALEEKLKNLKREGFGIRAMASELDSLNSNATRREEDSDSNAPAQSEGERLVPIRLTSNEPAALKTIEQKEAEIDAMKTQLRRLKDMMSTIESIENKARTAAPTPPKQTNISTARNVPIRNVGADSTNHMPHEDEHERTPTPRSSFTTAELERNSILLQGDLRAQGELINAEQERIMALQDDCSRHSQKAAAAAQLGEDALRRNTVTPTPSSLQHKDSDHEVYEKTNDTLGTALLASSQEYAEICRRIQELGPSGSQATMETARQQSVSRDSRSSAERNIPPSRNIENTSVPSTSNVAGQNIQEDMAADASNLQSNVSTSHAFTIPPSATTINGGVSWATGPHNWNYPNFRYTHPTSVIPPTYAFPPPPPPFAVPPFVSVPQPPVSLSALSGPTANNGIFYNPSHATPPGAVPTISPVIGPTIVDQNIVPQLVGHIHSLGLGLNQLNVMVCQIHREVDYLNRITISLQDRLRGGTVVQTTDIGVGFRSESVPPTFTAAGVTSHPSFNLTNTFSNSSNRAQSEQPLGNSSNGNAGQYLQEQHHFVQQQQHHQVHQQRQYSSNMGAGSSAGTYSESQQHVATAASGGNSSIYSTLNNANIAEQNVRPAQPASGHETAGPAPIFMHHHNNAIHQNNANLRRANVHAHTHVHPSSNDSTNTLNNQVPPGNRANNYWDNFKSYSRQNLFASNSNKSNEDNQFQQSEFDGDDNGEYRPENPRPQQIVRRHVQSSHRKCLHQQADHRSLNDLNTLGTNDSGDYTNWNNSDLRVRNQPRIKNFQQHRHQQPNPLPSGTVITNSLHANIPLNDTVNTFDQMGMVTEILDTQSHQFGHPSSDLDDQITAEMYGCNYEHSSSSASAMNERNINFGNSPNNRQGNKVATKFQYPIGMLSEQTMHLIESFLERWDKSGIEGHQEILNSRENINIYLRQLHELQSTLRFDPSFFGTAAISEYSGRHMYPREDYEDQEDAFYEQSDGNRYFVSTARSNDNVNINPVTSSRCSNIFQLSNVFERNLLINNRNARKPDKFVKKQAVSVYSRRLPSRYDEGMDENRATFSDSTDQRRGSKNRMAGNGRKSQVSERYDQAAVKNIQDNREGTTIRHALSDSNVTDTHSDALNPPPVSESPKVAIPEAEMTNQSQQDVPDVDRDTPGTSNIRAVIDFDTESTLDDSNTCDDIDFLGASSLAAQEHFQKKVILKKKCKERKVIDKQNKPKFIIEENRSSTEQNSTQSNRKPETYFTTKSEGMTIHLDESMLQAALFEDQARESNAYRQLDHILDEIAVDVNAHGTPAINITAPINHLPPLALNLDNEEKSIDSDSVSEWEGYSFEIPTTIRRVHQMLNNDDSTETYETLSTSSEITSESQSFLGFSLLDDLSIFHLQNSLYLQNLAAHSSLNYFNNQQKDRNYVGYQLFPM